MKPPEWEAGAQALRRLTAELLTGARAGDWDEVAALEAARAGLLPALLPAPADVAVAAVHRLIEDLLAVDAEVLELGGRAREALATTLGRFAAGGRARAAYGG